MTNEPFDPINTAQPAASSEEAKTPESAQSAEGATTEEGVRVSESARPSESVQPSGNALRSRMPVVPIDRLFAWLSIAFCFQWIHAFPVSSHSLGGMLMLILLYVFGALYLIGSRIRPKPTGIVFGGACLVLSTALITGEANFIHDLLYVALIFAFFYFIYDAAGLGGNGFLGANFFHHIPFFLFHHPCSGLSSIFPALFIRRAKSDDSTQPRRHTLAYVALGLVVAVVPTAIIISLLSYDRGFTDLMDRIFMTPLENITTVVRDLIYAFLFAVLLFGVLFSAKTRSQKNGGKEENVRTGILHVIPAVALCAAVTPVLCVYVIFFVSQFSYYVSAFTGVLPEGFSYAEYAREGFFQLCTVCAFNAILLLLLNVLVKTDAAKPKKSLATRIYSTVIILFTLILTATALSKMFLYIGYYGLTLKRVQAAWLIVLLATLFVLALPHQWVPKYPIVPVTVICTFLFLCLLLLPNVNAIIADYNVDHYLSGDLETVDIEAMEHLGDSAIPAVVRLEESLEGKKTLPYAEKKLKAETRDYLDRCEKRLEGRQEGILSFNLPEWKARQALRERK